MGLASGSAHGPSLQAAIGQSHLTDEALEELSESREPRQRAGRSVGGVSPLNDLPKFSTWAEGEQPQLDSITLSKHVKQMVDVCVCVCMRGCVRVSMRACVCV